MAVKKGTMISTIDVEMVTVKTATDEYLVTSASEVQVEAQVETTDAVKNIVNGVLLSQKPAVSTLTGHKITITDNTFIPEVVVIMQGGEVVYDTVDTTKITGYNPPIPGSGDAGEICTINLYSAVRDAAGLIKSYEKTSYPNCTGSFNGLNIKNGEFRAPTYEISSAPGAGEKPYTITYVTTLPVVG